MRHRNRSSEMLRPGNTGANNTADHVALFDQAVAALPVKYRAGHRPSEDPATVTYPVLVPADSAGASHAFVDVIIDANAQYSIGYQVDERVRDALNLVQEETLGPAVDSDGTRRDGPDVTELSDLVDLDGWGPGCRLICRGERPRPGAQLTIFDTINGYRHTCFITNTPPASGETTDDPGPNKVALTETRRLSTVPSTDPDIVTSRPWNYDDDVVCTATRCSTITMSSCCSIRHSTESRATNYSRSSLIRCTYTRLNGSAQRSGQA